MNPTAEPTTPTATPTPRPPLLSRALLLRFVSVVGSTASFFLLLSAVPAHAGRGGAGLATGSLMLSTVLGELAGPRILGRYGRRGPLAAGLFLLGAPALVLPLSDAPAWTAAVCLVRGLGFGLTMVAGGALTAALIPAGRRGEGLALVGVVGGVPALLALPLGIWLAGHLGYATVTTAAAVAALAALPTVPALRVDGAAAGGRGRARGGAAAGNRRTARLGAAAGGGREADLGMVGAVRAGGLRRPTMVFAATAVAAGILVTFLPLAVPPASGVATPALLVQSTASTAARWAAGRYGDRRGSWRLVVPGLLVSAAGLSALAATSSPVAVLVGAAVFGTGFGVTQNATLTLMYSRVSAGSYGTVSALWNLAYDGGMGVGAAGFGLLTAHTGYVWGFALTGILMLGALGPAVRDRRADARHHPARP
ncbi:MFS transporter [Streptomyces cyanogenus]|uniref:Major Facilitator Superfamily protein n=1 Tax=Streptomyces cyanogenus TaxID=80860 RepID=A0ABX7TWC5_STRCY|nr:MFS transporter [Streptomyces cyanogenus]QTE01080.1 Major Facilitator Superfamily protein [Streptomyces cyanogenus]